MIPGAEPGRRSGRFPGMVNRTFLRSSARYVGLYALVELIAVALLIWALGLGWALVVLAATFAVGIALVASQVRGQFVTVRRGQPSPESAVADGLLVGLGSFLVLLPGMVTTMAGALILAPPTRGAMRPLAATMLHRGVVRRMGSLNVTLIPDDGARVGRGDYIDGEIIDGEIIDGFSEQLPARR